MFYYLKGRAAHLAPNLAVIDCGGVGYACRTTSYTLSGLQMGQEVTLYTHLNVREDAMELYGFGTEKERNCFQLLIGVSGVGPKAALSILSATTPEGLATAIITGDEKALTVAQGIGKKIAQRILLELKDKLAKGQLPAGEERYGGTGEQELGGHGGAGGAGIQPGGNCRGAEGTGFGGALLGGDCPPGPAENDQVKGGRAA